MQNQHLVPELILNLIDQYKKAKSQNEKFVLEDRLNAITSAINEVLTSGSIKKDIWKK
jgi:hypothetical protein